MKQQEMQKPLIQSALVLLAAMLLIGFVAGSDAQGMFGGISSIFKGFFYTILYAIALAIALVVSVVCLFAIFLGAVALYSPDSAKSMYAKLLSSLSLLYSSSVSAMKKDTDSSTEEDTTKKSAESAVTHAVASPGTAASVSEDMISDLRHEFSEEIHDVGQTMALLSDQNRSLGNSLTQLQDTVAEIPLATMNEKTTALEASNSELSVKMDDLLEKIDKIQTLAEQASSSAKQQNDEITATKSKLEALIAEVDELKKAPTASVDSGPSLEISHRIFNYIENDDDKKKFAELIVQAIEKEMTYAEIDDFLTKSLSKEVDTIIKEHPSLTKQYIRDCKNN